MNKKELIGKNNGRFTVICESGSERSPSGRSLRMLDVKCNSCGGIRRVTAGHFSANRVGCNCKPIGKKVGSENGRFKFVSYGEMENKRINVECLYCGEQREANYDAFSRNSIVCYKCKAPKHPIPKDAKRYPRDDADLFVRTNGEVYSGRTGKKLKGTVNIHGYRITQTNLKYGVRINRVVAITFIPNPDNLPDVHHINGDKLDNRVENLQWVTQKQNTHYHLQEQNKHFDIGFKTDKWTIIKIVPKEERSDPRQKQVVAKCNQCGNEVVTWGNRVASGRTRCYVCKPKKLHDIGYVGKRYTIIEEMEPKVYKTNKGWKQVVRQVKVKCNECGHERVTTPSSIIRDRIKCRNKNCKNR
jgi:ribosomal protein S27E